MKMIYLRFFLVITAQLLVLEIFGQISRDYTIPLRKKTIAAENILDEKIISRLNKSVEVEATTCIIQFQNFPDQLQKQYLVSKGIQLLHYAGGHSYIASLSKPISVDLLKSVGSRTILTIEPEDKISFALQNVISDTTVHAILFPFADADDAINKLGLGGFTAQRVYTNYPVLRIQVPANRLKELAGYSFLEYIEPPPPEPIELNDKSTKGTRANVLHTPGYNLNGEGVTFQINEITNYPQEHIDFIGRSVNGKTATVSNYHSTHVHGIIAGAGLINELYKGYAPKARYVSSASTIDLISAANPGNNNIDITSNSYASGGFCQYYAPSISTFIADKQAIEFKSLIHVFAAGNSGNGYQCPSYPFGYKTVYYGHQSNKSMLTVGATLSNGTLANFSSRGPGRDGRLKPEIVAPGANITSTTPNNYYGPNNGTSMSCPAAAGGLGLLYQRYEQLYGSKPDNALMKPLLCNAATDLGPVGPDFGYGFGFMNLYRAIQILNAGNFYKDSVANNANKTKTIIVPQGIAKLKVMLYWQDPPVSPLVKKLLTNDLDLEVTAPNGSVILPYVLDTLPAMVTNAATHGVDHINNIEQVVIDAPTAGSYVVNVKGYEIGEGDQQAFYIVYDLVPDSVQITFPFSGEVLAPGDAISIQWDNWGSINSNLTLEFSSDNGKTWQTISSSIASGSTSFDWTVPSIATNEARLRLIRNGDGKTSSPEVFRITGVPNIQLSPSQCPGSIAIEWQPVAGATDYEVMWYRNGNMIPATTTTQTKYVFRNLSEDSVYWVTVRARNNGLPGRRAYALSVTPNKGTCTDTIFDHDLKTQTLLYPLDGRELTSKRLALESIRMRIKNLDDDPASSFTIAYSVNGGTWIRQTIDSTIAANGSSDYSFQTPYDFSEAGNYIVRLAVSNPGDYNHGNDTVDCIVRHLGNKVISLADGITENLESAPIKTYTSSYIGLDGIDRFDYESSSPIFNLAVDDYYSPNRTRCFQFINPQYTQLDKPQSLTATFNLSQFDTAKHSAGLDFFFQHYAQGSSSFDILLIRGSDKDSWISVQDLLPDSPRTVSRMFKNIPLTEYLKTARQNFSSSLQVRWSLSSLFSTAQLDSIKIYNTTSDAGINSIDSLLPYGCGLSNETPVWVTLQNNSNIALNNITVKYRINNGTIVSESVPSLPALSSKPYKFNKLADLSLPGVYNLETWSDYNDDSYRRNDTARLSVSNQQIIKQFPYLQDFEKNNGGWFTAGTNSSWEYGTPSSPLINGAASGVHAWKTNLDGNYNNLENSQLYAGCFDFSQLSKPVISMSIALNTDSCGANCDLMFLQYCTNGKDWRTMPLQSVYNWQQLITSKRYNRWHVASERTIDTFAVVQFRFGFRSDFYNAFEGIGLDDFHVYDSTATIYDGDSASVQQIINSGQGWITFSKDRKLLASIEQSGQHIGAIQLQTFINREHTRNFHGQYYLNRNFVFNPQKRLVDSVKIRLYFTDKESDSLLFAKNCTSCTLPKNAYRFGISYYKSNDSTELDSSITNNRRGEWNFIPNSKIKTVPFMTGYYAEFKAKDAGEFRLSNGGLNGESDLPVSIRNFSAEKLLSNTSLKWQTAQEINIVHFDIEVAKGNNAFKSDQYEKIGEVASNGRSTTPQSYNSTDNSPGKKGVYYYRLKSVDAFGNYSYSNVLPIVFNEDLQWQVFPNPSNGKFHLVYQFNAGDIAQVSLFNSIGQLIKEIRLTANGFIQDQEIDISKNNFAKGIYMLRIKTQERMYTLRLAKQ